ncbi:MAG TPA: PorT family protein [Candidatus Avirikenella pullistercoris]|nr:PorT family protein [Candidatus Avirikenella pullistercoris]
MKKFLLMIGLISIGLTAAAQPRFGYGIRAGMNLTDMVGKHSSITNDWRVGFAAGIFIDYRFTDAFALEGDVLYSQEGLHKIKSKDFPEIPGIKANMNYINVPVLAKFYPVGGFNMVVGPQASFLVKKKISGDILSGQEKHFIKDALNNTVLDLVVGIGYEFDFGLMFDLRYAIGLTKTFEKVDGTRFMKGNNSNLQLTAAWRF